MHQLQPIWLATEREASSLRPRRAVDHFCEAISKRRDRGQHLALVQQREHRLGLEAELAPRVQTFMIRGERAARVLQGDAGGLGCSVVPVVCWWS